jgi:hypothetical protein
MTVLHGLSLTPDLAATSLSTGNRVIRGNYSPFNTFIDFIAVQKRSDRVRLAKQSTAVNIRIRMLGVATGKGQSGVSGSMVIKIAKDGASSFTTITPTVTDLGNGLYNLALTSSHTDTLGSASLFVTANNCLPNDDIQLHIVAFDPQDRAMGSIPTGSVVSDAGNTVTSFKTNLIQVTADYWKDVFLTFTSGALFEQTKKVITFDGTTKFITVFGTGFTGTPSGGDQFYLVNK